MKYDRLFSSNTAALQADEANKAAPSGSSAWRVRRVTVLALAFCLWLSAGGAAIATVEGWHPSVAVYYVMETTLRIGYGDKRPRAPLSKAVCVVWVLGAFVIAAAGAGAALVYFLTESLLKARMAVVESLPRAVSSLSSAGVTAVASGLAQSVQTLDQRLSHTRQSAMRAVIVRRLADSLLLFGLVAVAVSVALLFVEDWGPVDNFYFIITSGCTIGYGYVPTCRVVVAVVSPPSITPPRPAIRLTPPPRDYHPTNSASRYLAMLYLPLTVYTLLRCVSNLVQLLTHAHWERVCCATSGAELTVEQLALMDTDGDGQVTRLEFTVFILKRLQLVTSQDLMLVHTMFARYDRSGTGMIDPEDYARVRRRMTGEGEGGAPSSQPGG